MPRRHPDSGSRGRGRSRPTPEREDFGRSAESLQQQRANCAAKARYGSEAEARSHSLMHTGGIGRQVKTYRCDVCDGWHFTRG